MEIHPEFRSRGIGTRLVETAARTLVERGHERVALAVEIGNVRARKLYERLGYRVWRHPAVPYVHCYDLFDDSGGSPEVCHVMVKCLR